MSISTWISLWKLSRDDKLMDVKLSWVCGAVTLKFNICIYKGTNSTICHPCFWLSTLKLFADCSKFNKYTFSLSNTHTHTETPKTKKKPNWNKSLFWFYSLFLQSWKINSLQWNQDSDVSVFSVGAALARTLATSLLLLNLENIWYCF